MNWMQWQVVKWKVPAMLDKLKTFAVGYGTYGVGVASILYGACGYVTGALEHDAAARAVIDGVGLLFLRRAVGK